MSELPPPTADAAAKWSLTWKGRTFHQDDLTGEHLAFLALLTGWDGWHHATPDDIADMNPATGPVRTMNLLAAFVCVADALEEPEQIAAVIQDIRATSVSDLLDSIRFA